MSISQTSRTLNPKFHVLVEWRKTTNMKGTSKSGINVWISVSWFIGRLGFVFEKKSNGPNEKIY